MKETVKIMPARALAEALGQIIPPDEKLKDIEVAWEKTEAALITALAADMMRIENLLRFGSKSPTFAVVLKFALSGMRSTELELERRFRWKPKVQCVELDVPDYTHTEAGKAWLNRKTVDELRADEGGDGKSPPTSPPR